MDKISIEKVAIVGLLLPGDDVRMYEASLDELEKLIETAGGEAVVKITQSRESPDSRTFIGSGKIAELSDACHLNQISVVVADRELSPSQIKNMEDEVNKDHSVKSGGESKYIRVIDRSMLILDIFALHAATNEGKIQVELAQLKYTVPRLTGHGVDMSRQQGGNIAMRGPGESKLESDRRHVRRRMHALEEELEEIEVRRATRRKQRDRAGIVKVAVAGYTNAGKSTLVNRLTDAGVLAEDKLFATLDPTTRKYTLPSGNEILLIDTVGFIRNLPHHLIKAFRSTLDEVSYADIVLVLADASDPECISQLEVTGGLLNDMNCGTKPIICALNKYDRCEDIPGPLPTWVPHENVVMISALEGDGIEKLIALLEKMAAEKCGFTVLRIPNNEQAAISRLYGMATVLKAECNDEFTEIEALCDARTRGLFEKWMK